MGSRRRARIEGFGAWYGEKQGETGDTWHRYLIDPGLLARIGPVPPGTRVLDLGCGNGYLARRLARAGARVIGTDRSGELLAIARRSEAREPLGVRYLRADAAELSALRSGSFELVFANMSLIDIEDAAGAIREAGRLLVPGGRFVFSISHPCFDIDTRSAWVIERSAGVPALVQRKVSGYREPHADRYPWRLGGGRLAMTTGYHRPLEWYAHALRSSGFVIVELDEPRPLEGYSSPAVPREWIEAIPMHLVVEARREPGSGAPTNRFGPSPRTARPSRRARARRARRRAPRRAATGGPRRRSR